MKNTKKKHIYIFKEKQKKRSGLKKWLCSSRIKRS